MKNVLCAAFLLLAFVFCTSCEKEVKGLRDEMKIVKEENSYLKAENIALKKELEPLLEDDKEPVRLRAAAGYLRLSAIQAGRVK